MRARAPRRQGEALEPEGARVRSVLRTALRNSPARRSDPAAIAKSPGGSLRGFLFLRCVSAGQNPNRARVKSFSNASRFRLVPGRGDHWPPTTSGSLEACSS